MKPDAEIEEVRAVRHRISEECGHDPKRLIAYYKQVSHRLKQSGRFRFADSKAVEKPPAPKL